MFTFSYAFCLKCLNFKYTNHYWSNALVWRMLFCLESREKTDRIDVIYFAMTADNKACKKTNIDEFCLEYCNDFVFVDLVPCIGER